MGIEPLYELRERLYSSSVAGVSLMSEDFRLKRAIDQMEPMAKAAPIFKKIYEGAVHLLEVSEKERANVLLDEIALLDAVLVTQATAGIEGELTAINEGLKETIETKAPYSKVMPVLEALTTSGSGHYSYLLEIHKDSPEIFQDFRLKEAMVKGLGAGYSELAEKVEQWLSKENSSYLPILKRGFQPNGKKEMVRRVRVIESIAGASENDWYLSMLEKAQKEVKEALIYALRHEKANEQLLFQLTRTEKGAGRKAAIWALIQMKSSQVASLFQEQLKSNASTVWKEKYFCLLKEDVFSDLLAEEINKELDFIEAWMKEDSSSLTSAEAKRLERMLKATPEKAADIRKDLDNELSLLLEAMIGKTSDKMIQVYRRLVDSIAFSSLALEEKNKNMKKQEQTLWKLVLDLKRVGDLLTNSILFTKSPKLYALAEEFYKRGQREFLEPALTTALLTKNGEEVFSEFSHYLIPDGKKESTERQEGRFAIMSVFSMLTYNEELDRYQLVKQFYDPNEYEIENSRSVNEEGYAVREGKIVRETLFGELDIRWIELLTSRQVKKNGDFRSNGFNSRMYSWDHILEKLIRPNDERTCELLGSYFYDRLLCNNKNINLDPFSYYERLKKCHFYIKRGDIVQPLMRVKTVSVWLVKQMIEKAPMTKEDKRAELEEINKLMEEKKLKMNYGNWGEDTYYTLMSRI